MSEPTIYITTVHETDHPVRATNKRSAETMVLNDRVTTRRATNDEIIRIVRSGQRIIGDIPEPDDSEPELPMTHAPSSNEE